MIYWTYSKAEDFKGIWFWNFVSEDAWNFHLQLGAAPCTGSSTKTTKIKKKVPTSRSARKGEKRSEQKAGVYRHS